MAFRVNAAECQPRAQICVTGVTDARKPSQFTHKHRRSARLLGYASGGGRVSSRPAQADQAGISRSAGFRDRGLRGDPDAGRCRRARGDVPPPPSRRARSRSRSRTAPREGFAAAVARGARGGLRRGRAARRRARGALPRGHARVRLGEPAERPTAETHDRFALIAGIVAGALRRLGVDARIGEVPGEYCPGAWSVNARGAVKLAGIGQRIVAGGAHVGGVLVVTDGALLRETLDPVYAALGLEWDPATAGAVEDEAAGRHARRRRAGAARRARRALRAQRGGDRPRDARDGRRARRRPRGRLSPPSSLGSSRTMDEATTRRSRPAPTTTSRASRRSPRSSSSSTSSSSSRSPR